LLLLFPSAKMAGTKNQHILLLLSCECAFMRPSSQVRLCRRWPGDWCILELFSRCVW
jgi:hypothetical protein